MDRTSHDARPCPACPDGYVWTTQGQTGAPCRTCGGFAVVHLDGRRFTAREFHGLDDVASEHGKEGEG